MRNKAPDPSGITEKQIKYLPQNCKMTLVNIYNAILDSGHSPMAPKTTRMIFNAKPNKDKHKPESFSPISLLEVTGKVSNRLNYVAFNYLFTEKWFGFRTH